MLEETKMLEKRVKSFTLLSGMEENWHWDIICKIKGNGAFRRKGAYTVVDTKEQREKYKEKNLLRQKDKLWVANNIPSSIWWFSEVHHDWNNGGVMYLLTKGEHILRHRKEKKK